MGKILKFDSLHVIILLIITLICFYRLHKFQVKKFEYTDEQASKRSKRGNLLINPSFYFFFDGNTQLTKVRLEQEHLGSIDFVALHPIK